MRRGQKLDCQICSNRSALGLLRLLLLLQYPSLDRPSKVPIGLAGIVLEDVVHLLEGAPFRLGHEEKGPQEGEDTEDGEEDVGTVAGVLDEGWSDQALSGYVNGGESPIELLHLR